MRIRHAYKYPNPDDSDRDRDRHGLGGAELTNRIPQRIEEYAGVQTDSPIGDGQKECPGYEAVKYDFH